MNFNFALSSLMGFQVNMPSNVKIVKIDYNLQVTLPSETSTRISFLELYIQNILAFQNASCNGLSLLFQKSSFFNILGTFLYIYFMVLKTISTPCIKLRSSSIQNCMLVGNEKHIWVLDLTIQNYGFFSYWNDYLESP